MSDWKAPYAYLPRNLKADEKLRFAVKYTLLASSGVCWPPCEYRIVQDIAELIAKSDPVFEAVDHEGRETVIGCGVSLQLFKLTLKHLGCLGRVELFPNLDCPMLAARIHVGGAGERDALEGCLFTAMKQDDPPVPLANGFLPSETALAALERAAEEERAWLQFAKRETSWERLHTLAVGPPRLEIEDSPAPDEVSRQLAAKPREPSAIDDGPHQSRGEPALPGTFAVLKTKTDDKHGWLAAGQALARLILQARVSGISCSSHNEPLRSSQVRAALRTEIGRKGFAQAILRFSASWPATFVQPAIASLPTTMQWISPAMRS